MTVDMSDSPGRTLHDRIFKEFLHRFLPDFLRLFFPDEAARLDLANLTFLDQELIINLPEQTLRITDVVAEVATLAGEGEVIIVHVEVEGRARRSLPQRMFEYYSLLRILRQKRVLPLALVLLPQAGGVGWQVYQEIVLGRRVVEFYYGQVGLRDLHSEDYLGDNPVAAALAALMQPTHLHLAEVKLAGLQGVIKSDLTEGDKLFLTLLSANCYVTKNRNGGMLVGKTFHHKGNQKHATSSRTNHVGPNINCIWLIRRYKFSHASFSLDAH